MQDIWYATHVKGSFDPQEESWPTGWEPPQTALAQYCRPLEQPSDSVAPHIAMEATKLLIELDDPLLRSSQTKWSDFTTSFSHVSLG